VLSTETRERVAALLVANGIDPWTPPHKAALMLCRVLGRAKQERLVALQPLGRRARALAEIAEGLCGRRTPVQMLAAADSLGVGIKEAMRVVTEKINRGEITAPSGWNREPGQDDDEVGA